MDPARSRARELVGAAGLKQPLLLVEDRAITLDSLASNTLPGFADRAVLLRDLSEAVRAGSPPSLVSILSLEGYDKFGETYGTPAQQALAARLAARLRATLQERGTCYRAGQDELAVLITAPIGEALPLLKAAVTALRHLDRLAPVTASFGAAALPDEADSAAAAIHLATERLATNTPRHTPRRRTVYQWNT
jgi:GGDEF domain-containing protein